MCLSTVYKNKLDVENMVMRNVMTIECRDGMVMQLLFSANGTEIVIGEITFCI